MVSNQRRSSWCHQQRPAGVQIIKSDHQECPKIIKWPIEVRSKSRSEGESFGRRFVRRLIWTTAQIGARIIRLSKYNSPNAIQTFVPGKRFIWRGSLEGNKRTPRSPLSAFCRILWHTRRTFGELFNTIAILNCSVASLRPNTAVSLWPHIDLPDQAPG